MSDTISIPTPVDVAPTGASVLTVGVLTVGVLADWVTVLAGLERDVSDHERIDQIRALEEIKAAASAAQARATADLDASVRAGHSAARIRSADHGKGVGAQIGLARRESPNRGAQHLGLAKALVHEMPHTLAGLSSGRLSEWRATLLVRETACLTRADRATVDRVLAGDPTRLDGKGDRALVAEAKKLTYRLDPHAFVRRARKAETERRVSIRPAPDTMAYLTALLPVQQAVATYAALTQAAEATRAGGDTRGRGQIMADTLVERVTGQAAATAVPVEVQLVVTDQALFNNSNEPAHVPGYGPIPADTARDWLTHPDVHAWLRRLYTHPTTRQLVAMDSVRRTFDGNLRTFLITRDQVCRTPWCDAPIRHIDHVVPASAGGRTSATNGQGLCEACNYTKQAPGWRTKPEPGPRHTIHITTPTGHTYHSTAPPPATAITNNRARRDHDHPCQHTTFPDNDPSKMERHFHNYILAG